MHFDLSMVAEEEVVAAAEAPGSGVGDGLGNIGRPKETCFGREIGLSHSTNILTSGPRQPER